MKFQSFKLNKPGAKISQMVGWQERQWDENGQKIISFIFYCLTIVIFNSTRKYRHFRDPFFINVVVNRTFYRQFFGIKGQKVAFHFRRQF